jgi:hypothetical protein
MQANVLFCFVKRKMLETRGGSNGSSREEF